MTEQSEGKINSDCSVCKRLLKSKYQAPKWLYALVLVLLMSTTVLGVLYFGEGNIGGTTENNVNIKIDNELDNGSNAENNVNTGNNSTISGKIESNDKSGLYLMIAIVCSCVIVSGSIVYANNHRKKDN